MRRRTRRVVPLFALTSLLLSVMVPVAAIAVDEDPEPEAEVDATLVFQKITCPSFEDVVYNADNGGPDDTFGQAPPVEDRKTTTTTGPIAEVLPDECAATAGATFRVGRPKPSRSVVDDLAVYTYPGFVATTDPTDADGIVTVQASDLIGQELTDLLILEDEGPYITEDGVTGATFASLQCQNDMAGLDNLERLYGVEDGDTVYCTAWNVAEPVEPEVTTVTINKSWNDEEGTDITSQVTGTAAFSVKVGDELVTDELVTSPANDWSDTVDISDVAASFEGETVDIEETLTDISVTDCSNPSVTMQGPDPSDPLVVGGELIIDVVNTVTCEAPEPPAPSVPAGAIPFVGDWNGDGTATPGWFHESRWYLVESPGGEVISFFYGRGTDTPVVGDWNASGEQTIGVRRGNRWFLRNDNSGGAPDLDFYYGRSTDVPVVGDWNASGEQTIGVRRGNRWFLRNDNSGGAPALDFYYGRATDIPVVGDYDGSGEQTVGVRRGSRWFLRNDNSGGAPDLDFFYGRATDIPVVGDWNNSGQETVGVVRNGTWLLKNTNSGGANDITYDYR